MANEIDRIEENIANATNTTLDLNKQKEREGFEINNKEQAMKQIHSILKSIRQETEYVEGLIENVLRR